MPTSREDAPLAIARLTRPHGVRGEINAQPHVPEVIDFAELLQRPILLRSPDGRTRPVRVESARAHQDRWLIKLADVDDRTGAESLRHHELCLRRGDLPELPEDWFWEADLVGCTVIDERLGPIGEVQSLDTDMPQVRLTIRRPEGGEVYIPWRKAYVEQVDLSARTIRVDLPGNFPGLND